MTARISNCTKALAALLLAGAAAAAHAGPGNGIRLGGSEGRLHPFLDLETRYDSNVSYSPDDRAIADVIQHVRPGLELKIPGDLAAIEFTGAVDWAQYLAVEGKTANLSKTYADAALGALFNRRGAVSLRVDSNFQRQVATTSFASAAAPVISNSSLVSIAVPVKPGGGALVATATGQWLLVTHERYGDAAPDPGETGYSHFRGGAEFQWRFLPRTSALLAAGYFTRVPEATLGDDGAGFDVVAGLTGLLTPRIGANLKVGYGSTAATAHDVDPDTGRVVDERRTTGAMLADVGLEWLPAESISLRAGYTRSVGIDPLASTYVSDGVTAGFGLKLASRLAFRAGVRWDRIAFQKGPGEDTSFLRIDPTIEGAVGRWLAVALGYVRSARQASSPEQPDYAKDEAFFRLGVTY